MVSIHKLGEILFFFLEMLGRYLPSVLAQRWGFGPPCAPELQVLRIWVEVMWDMGSQHDGKG
jgi:hypothetical protein